MKIALTLIALLTVIGFTALLSFAQDDTDSSDDVTAEDQAPGNQDLVFRRGINTRKNGQCLLR